MINKIHFSLKQSKSSASQRGQILIIFLLILVVGLAVVLSVASRSITDIRITTTSDESNRAYFAAEAGVEEALRRIEKSGVTNIEADLDFTAINQTKAKIKAKDLDATGVDAYEFQNSVEKDGVAQVSLLTDFSDIDNGTPADPSDDSPVPGDAELAVYWGDKASIDGGAVNPAIEVTVVYWDGSDFGLRKFAFDGVGVRAGANNFCSIPTVVIDPAAIDTNLNTSKNFKNSVSVKIRTEHPAAECGIAQVGIGAATTPVLARIRLLYNDDEPQPVAVGSAGPTAWNLPVQGSEVESTGTTTSGVTRKLEVIQQFPALPAIFDYVLFSGGNLTK